MSLGSHAMSHCILTKFRRCPLFSNLNSVLNLSDIRKMKPLLELPFPALSRTGIRFQKCLFIHFQCPIFHLNLKRSRPYPLHSILDFELNISAMRKIKLLLEPPSPGHSRAGFSFHLRALVHSWCPFSHRDRWFFAQCPLHSESNFELNISSMRKIKPLPEPTITWDLTSYKIYNFTPFFRCWISYSQPPKPFKRRQNPMHIGWDIAENAIVWNPRFQE